MGNNTMFIEDSLNMAKKFGGEVASKLIQPHRVRTFELRRLQRSVSLNMVRKLGVLRGDRVKKCEEPHIKGKWCLRNQKAQYSCLKIEVNLFISHEQD